MKDVKYFIKYILQIIAFEYACVRDELNIWLAENNIIKVSSVYEVHDEDRETVAIIPVRGRLKKHFDMLENKMLLEGVEEFEIYYKTSFTYRSIFSVIYTVFGETII